MKLALSEYELSQVGAEFPDEAQLQSLGRTRNVAVEITSTQVVSVPREVPRNLAMTCESCHATWNAEMLPMGSFDEVHAVLRRPLHPEAIEYLGRGNEGRDFDPFRFAWLACPNHCPHEAKR